MDKELRELRSPSLWGEGQAGETLLQLVPPLCPFSYWARVALAERTASCLGLNHALKEAALDWAGGK